MVTYRSKDGRHYFSFRFVSSGSHIEVFCDSHPSLNGVDADVHKTHLWPSGRICFVDGRAPTTNARAQELAGQWAEYLLEYRRTGVAQA